MFDICVSECMIRIIVNSEIIVCIYYCVCWKINTYASLIYCNFRAVYKLCFPNLKSIAKFSEFTVNMFLLDEKKQNINMHKLAILALKQNKYKFEIQL